VPSSSSNISETALQGSLGVLAKAADVENDVAAVIVGGTEVKALASEIGRFGAGTVHVRRGRRLQPAAAATSGRRRGEGVQEGGYDTVLMSNSCSQLTSPGAWRSARRRLNWDLVDMVRSNGSLVGKRLCSRIPCSSRWGGARLRLALFRPGSFEPVERGGQTQVETVSVELEDHSRAAS